MVFLAVFPVISAHGQTKNLQGNISFDFKVGNKVFPAGQYKFTPDTIGKYFTIEGPGNVSGTALVITRVAGEIHTTPNDAHVVFDKVGETYFLAEIWIPGQDGFLLHSMRGKHEHRIVNVPL